METFTRTALASAVDLKPTKPILYFLLPDYPTDLSTGDSLDTDCFSSGVDSTRTERYFPLAASIYEN